MFTFCNSNLPYRLTGWPPFYDKNLKTMCEKILTAELKFPSKPVSTCQPLSSLSISHQWIPDNSCILSRISHQIVEVSSVVS